MNDKLRKALERIYVELMRQGSRPYDGEIHKLDSFLYMYAELGREGNIDCINYLSYVIFKFYASFILYSAKEKYSLIPLIIRISKMYKYNFRQDLSSELYKRILRFSIYLAEISEKTNDFASLQFLYRIYAVEYVDGWLKEQQNDINEKKLLYYDKLIHHNEYCGDEICPRYWKQFENYSSNQFERDCFYANVKISEREKERCWDFWDGRKYFGDLWED